MLKTALAALVATVTFASTANAGINLYLYLAEHRDDPVAKPPMVCLDEGRIECGPFAHTAVRVSPTNGQRVDYIRGRDVQMYQTMYRRESYYNF